MDSFLEEPRSIPKPTPVIQEMQTPHVPEVSLMFQNSKHNKSSSNVKSGKPIQSYNAWKLRSSPINNSGYDSFLLTSNNKENGTVQTEERSFLSKKQVRFESPKNDKVPHYPLIFNNKVIPTSQKLHNIENTNHTMLNDIPKSHCGHIRPQNIENSSQNYVQTFQKPIVNLQNIENTNRKTMNDIPKSYSNRLPQNIIETTANLQTKTQTNFQNSLSNMYVSHLPNRELDLSFLEVTKNPCYTTKNTGISLKNTQYPYVDSSPNMNSQRIHFNTTDNLLTRINTTDHNLIRENKYIPQTETNKNETITSVETVEKLETPSDNLSSNTENIDSSNTTNNTDSNTPSVTDLLTIIKLQNEQLKLLQSQVAKLVKLAEKSDDESATETTENQSSETPKKVVLYKDQQVGTSFFSGTEKPQQKISVGMMTSFEVSFKNPSTTKRTKKKHLSPVQDFSFLNKSPIFDKTKAKKHDFKRHGHPIPEHWKQTNETEYSLGPHDSLDIQETPESPENSIHIDMQEYESDSSEEECSSIDTGWTFYKDILGKVNNILDNTSSNDCKQPNRHRNEREPTTDTTLNKIKYAAIKRLENDGFMKSKSKKEHFKPNEISFAVKQILMKYMPDEDLADAVNSHEKYQKEPRRDVPVQTFKYLQQYNVMGQKPQYYGGKSKTLNKTRKPSPNNDPNILDITTLKQQPKLL